MPFIILVELYYQDPKMQECGMPWEAAMRKSGNLYRLKNVMKELNVLKIERA
jgi:hypothetical protein